MAWYISTADSEELRRIVAYHATGDGFRKRAQAELDRREKRENEGDCTCEPAVGRGAHRIEREIDRGCPEHGEAAEYARSREAN